MAEIAERDREMARESLRIRFACLEQMGVGPDAVERAHRESVDRIAALLAAEREQQEAGLVEAVNALLNAQETDEWSRAVDMATAALAGRPSPLVEENRKLRNALDKKSGALTGIIGQCPQMLEVFSTIRKVATSDVAVLVQGESGTGKELVARAIHAASSRREREFIPINCGAIPENLLESELFGHERGAFTGAHTQVQGKVEYAQGGTLFLDEIGELPPPLQVKLLRFLQDKTIQRVGGREDIAVDVRIVAATNRKILDDIKNGRFREDLYYRVGVVTIQLPPLRERKEDITLLGTLFLMRFSEEFKKRIKGFSAGALEQMESYTWPGNVRELENKIQRAVILSEGPLVEPHDLGFSARPAPASLVLPGTTLKDARDRVERQMIVQAMDRNKGNIAQAAEDLGISRPTFYDIMKKHGLFHITQQSASLAPPER